MSDKPRVFLVAESLAPGNGGICRVARLMARVLDEQVSQGTLEASSAALSDSEQPAGVALPVSLARGSRIKLAKDVHVAALNYSHFIYDFVGMARAHPRVVLRKPFMIYIHGIEIWRGTRGDRIAAARRANRLLSNTTYTRQRANVDFGGFEHVKTCWLATETDDLPNIPYTPDKPPTVLILSRLVPESGKGHEELIDCWPEVAAAVPGARLIIGGRGPAMDDLKRRAADRKMESLIEFPGFIPDDQIDSLWSRATVFAMPSRVEGFGLVYIEAMRYGVPVIAAIHDAAHEINLDGVTGFNVNMDQKDELPRRIIELLGNPYLATQFSRNAQQRWYDHFRFSAWRERFSQHLWEFLNNC